MQQTITFPVRGLELTGWFFKPEGAEKSPAIILTHGLGAVMEMGLEKTAETLVQAGFACLVYDHRNTGLSAGEPRGELDPWQQVNDMRDAVTYVSARDDVDQNRIGLWGTSWSGGHVIVMGATDRRIKCVVAQVPTISGHRNTLRATPADKLAGFLQEIYQERADRLRGEEPKYVRISAEGSDGDSWSKVAGADTSYKNSMTLLSREYRMAYEPGIYISRIAPTPFMMIAARDDVRTPVDEQLAAYAQALEPKRLVILNGGHYSAYLDQFETASEAACEWFVEIFEIFLNDGLFNSIVSHGAPI